MRCSFVRFEFLLIVVMPLTISACLVSFNDYPLERQDAGLAGSAVGGGSSGADAGGSASNEAGANNVAGAGGSGNEGGCLATGSEACDGLDNDCSGGIDDDACPADCLGRALNGRGYMICLAEKSHAAASSDCEQQGMRLATIESAEENDWLLRTIQAFGVSQEVTFILSGSDGDEEGTWKWHDGTQFWSGAADGRAVDGRYANWDYSQPNENDDPPGEDCVTFQIRNGFWNDQSCTDGEYSVLCEAD